MASLLLDPAVFRIAEGLQAREQDTLMRGRPTNSTWRAPARRKARPRSAGASRRPAPSQAAAAKASVWERLSSDHATRTLRKMRSQVWVPTPPSVRRPPRFYRDLTSIGGERRARWNGRHAVSASQINPEVSGRQRSTFGAPRMADNSSLNDYLGSVDAFERGRMVAFG